MRKQGLKQKLLLQLEENHIDYGWATDSVLQLCRLNPEITSFLIEAPNATQHYVCLCLLGLTNKQRNRSALQDLAGRIATESRRQLLSSLWGKDIGSTRVLQKLASGIFSKQVYQNLITCLTIPERKRLFHDVALIYPLIVEHIFDATPIHLQRYQPFVLATFGGATLDFLHHGMTRLRPDVLPDDLLSRINALKSPSAMNRMIENLTQDMAIPMPPWAGTKTIIPLQRLPDFKSTGLMMKNCLNRLEIWIEALIQTRVFYLCGGKEPAIAALQRHRLFNTWFLQELSGRHNKRLSFQRKAEIIQAFNTAGFLYPNFITLAGMELTGF